MTGTRAIGLLGLAVITVALIAATVIFVVTGHGREAAIAACPAMGATFGTFLLVEDTE